MRRLQRLPRQDAAHPGAHRALRTLRRPPPQSTEVSRGKPAPDLFLHAAQQMGVDPEACVVVEDSRPGVHAARAAGMRAFGYAGGLTLPSASRATTPSSSTTCANCRTSSPNGCRLSTGHRTPTGFDSCSPQTHRRGISHRRPCRGRHRPHRHPAQPRPFRAARRPTRRRRPPRGCHGFGRGVVGVEEAADAEDRQRVTHRCPLGGQDQPQSASAGWRPRAPGVAGRSGCRSGVEWPGVPAVRMGRRPRGRRCRLRRDGSALPPVDVEPRGKPLAERPLHYAEDSGAASPGEVRGSVPSS